MSKMTLKLATDKVITALTVKLATTKSDYATYEKNEEAFSEARDKWNKDIVAYYKLMQKSLKKMGKGVVADIPVSGVESIPYPMVNK
jgi:hypothetical protein